MDETLSNLIKLIVIIIFVILAIFFVYQYLGSESGSVSATNTLWTNVMGGK